MTGHIRRFLDSPNEETQESFMRLFGSGSFKTKIQGVAKLDREDAAVEEYAHNAKTVGNYSFGCNAIILHPEMNRIHFHLIYLTRNLKGVEVFKETEKKAMTVQEAARAEAQQRKRIAKQGQIELFESSEIHDSTHYESLRDRYLEKAKSLVQKALIKKQQLFYDEAWILALSEPLTWESDLKQWIDEWKKKGFVEVKGMKPRQLVPHRNERNILVWK